MTAIIDNGSNRRKWEMTAIIDSVRREWQQWQGMAQSSAMEAIAGNGINHRRWVAIGGNDSNYRRWGQSGEMAAIAGNGSNRRCEQSKEMTAIIDKWHQSSTNGINHR